MTALTILQPDVAQARAVNPKPPPPIVDSSWQKEGARLIGKKTVTGRRYTPPRSQKHRKVDRGTHAPVEMPITRENLPVDEELVDSRLNDGVCGPVGPDGTRSGPSRCRYWNIPNPRTEQTFEQAVDQIRQLITTQTVLVAFPKLRATVQPAGRTLVNLDTIVYTDKSTVTTRPVTLLGYPVLVEATPVSYTWHFGDGSPAVTTRSPGKPYPSKEITHKYLKRGSVQVSVTTNYSARFNVAGTGWRNLAGSVPVNGPQTSLLVREAVPVLVDPPR
ncbi:PKD domain-containing protein [Kribbella sancticallisti]